MHDEATPELVKATMAVAVAIGLVDAIIPLLAPEIMTLPVTGELLVAMFGGAMIQVEVEESLPT